MRRSYIAPKLLKGVIVYKWSKLRWDCLQLGIDEAAAIELYQEQELEVDRIVDSHHRQLAGLADLQAAFPQATVLTRDAFATLPIDSFDFVIAYGGDNHFLYVSQFVDQAMIIGVNADDQTSVGALLEFTPADGPQIARLLRQGSYTNIHWTRMSVTLNDRLLSRRVLGEVYLGHKNPLLMSRYRLTYNDLVEEQKSSGVLVSTGCGSTGWLANVVQFWDPQHLPHPIPFDRTLPLAVFVVREIGQGSIKAGTLELNQPLVIQSMMDKGIISLNSEAFDRRFLKPFKAGSTAVIRPDTGLWVLPRYLLEEG